MFDEFRVGRPEKISDQDQTVIFGRKKGRPPVKLYSDPQSGLLTRWAAVTVQRYVLLAVASVALCLLIAYAADFAFLEIKTHRDGGAFGTVTVRPYYAVPQKNGKYEFTVADPQNVTCVHSLFPHRGYMPCWYVERHTEQRIDM